MQGSDRNQGNGQKPLTVSEPPTQKYRCPLEAHAELTLGSKHSSDPRSAKAEGESLAGPDSSPAQRVSGGVPELEAGLGPLLTFRV